MTAYKVKSFDVLIEIPKGSRNKYEYDFELKKIRLHRISRRINLIAYVNYYEVRESINSGVNACLLHPITQAQMKKSLIIGHFFLKFKYYENI